MRSVALTNLRALLKVQSEDCVQIQLIMLMLLRV